MIIRKFSFNLFYDGYLLKCIFKKLSYFNHFNNIELRIFTIKQRLFDWINLFDRNISNKK